MAETEHKSADEASPAASNEVVRQASVPGAPGAIIVPEDPTAPSKEVSSKRQRMSDLFTIFCCGW
jgi:hypothetical protein